MAIRVKIKQKLADGVYSAIGTVDAKDSNKKPVSGPAEVLVKQVEGTKARLHLDSQLMTSKIFNKEVLLYTELEGSAQVGILKEGMEVTFPKTIFNLKK
jgi:hypothetical protein